MTTKNKTNIAPANPETIQKASALLRAGQLVAVPTETVYGLAADAFNSAAVSQIFFVKKRPAFDPLIVHVRQSLSSIDALHQAGIVDSTRITFPMRATMEKLIAAYWPGPLTMLFPRGAKIPDLVTSGLEKVAVRMPAQKDFQALLEASQLNLAAPSANLFGHVSPTSAQHVFNDIGTQIPLIIDGGSCEFGLESTIVDINSDGNISILRRGALVLDADQGLSTKVISATPSPSAPGMLEKHYAPFVPLYLLENIDAKFSEIQKHQVIGLILPSPDAQCVASIESKFPHARVVTSYLCSDNRSETAAQNLFAVLREFESSTPIILVSLPTSQDGLWPAISERLQKAANHWIL